jgi:HJR/Mrr/RecB family endonuclease
MTREERYAAVIEEVLDILTENSFCEDEQEVAYAKRLLFWARDGETDLRAADGSWSVSHKRPVRY